MGALIQHPGSLFTEWMLLRSEVGEGVTFLWNPSCGSLLETWWWMILTVFLMYCQRYHIKQALSEENSRIRAVSLGIGFKGLCCGPRAFGCLTTLGSFKGSYYFILLLTLFCMSVCINCGMKYGRTGTDTTMSCLFYALIMVTWAVCVFIGLLPSPIPGAITPESVFVILTSLPDALTLFHWL